ncbi:MAG: BLUF domain-containing protein [Rubrivivax sp.]|nr:MAG: BLUF domain-containing protein [Rubrivivax sp.]
MLHRLIYVSRSRQPLPLDVKDILASSRANNPRIGVTGALCFLDGVYFQCLEGDSRVLAELYRFIERDSRHTEPRLLVQERIDKRLFADWSMALMTWAEETKAIFEYFHPGSAHDLYDIAQDKARLLIESFAASRNWKAV